MLAWEDGAITILAMVGISSWPGRVGALRGMGGIVHHQTTSIQYIFAHINLWLPYQNSKSVRRRRRRATERSLPTARNAYDDYEQRHIGVRRARVYIRQKAHIFPHPAIAACALLAVSRARAPLSITPPGR